MRIEPFTLDHYRRLAVQPAQLNVADFLDEIHAAALAEGPSFTALFEGSVVGMGGAVVPWPGRAQLWAIVGRQAGPHFVEIHRAVQRFLATLPQHRIEATVHEGFDAGHRWLRLLGMHCETPDGMAGYGPDRTRHYLYAMVR